MVDSDGLRCRGLTKRFPGVVALADVDLDVGYGEVVVLLGENGAGKSTLMKLISGVHAPDEGEMHLDGEPYRPSDPRAAIDAGIGMIHQEMNLLPALSAAENIFLGRQPRRGPVIDYPTMAERARELMGKVGLDTDPTTPLRRLSIAQQQLTEIAKALSLDARLLILDEPTAALGRADSDRLFGLVRELRSDGVGFVYISHRLEEVAQIGDRVIVLRDGERAAVFDDATTSTDEFISAMVGRDVEREFPEPAPAGDDVVLEVDGLTRAGAFSDVGFTLHRGEILGFAGLVGAGRTEVARALFGAEPPDSGTMRLNGEPYAPSSPADAVSSGIVLIPEDRKTQGLVLELSVGDNVVLPSLPALGGLVTPSAVEQVTDEQIERLEIKGRARQSANTLSGGNQQKVVIGKWLRREPRVIIFDEPTRGVDVGAKPAIHDVIRGLAEEGAGVIVISSELPEVLGLAHRVLVLSGGQQTALLDRADADEEHVMTAAVEAT
ncbi:sugar ABC transporter ATP-binding protein [soil metagenome]